VLKSALGFSGKKGTFFWFVKERFNRIYPFINTDNSGRVKPWKRQSRSKEQEMARQKLPKAGYKYRKSFRKIRTVGRKRLVAGVITCFPVFVE
jgi:hypothetical protein